MKINMIKRGNRFLQMAAVLSMAVCISGCGANGVADPAEAENVEILAGSETQEADSAPSDASSTEDNSTLPEGSESSQENENTATCYCFIANGGTISLDMDMDELAAELGESKSVFTAPSCAGEGITYVYDFASYEIETYPASDGKNRIGYIIFKDDMVATAEGIDLSMTREDVLRIYGTDGEESDNKITYEKDGTKLNFLFEGDSMVSIEYASAVMG